MGRKPYGSFVESKIIPAGLFGFAPTVNVVSNLDKNVSAPPIHSIIFCISWISPNE
jgi:hypothetical protein